MLYSHLCTTDSKVKTNSWAAPGDYYSYTNIFNPAPCAEAAAGWTVAYLKATVPSVDWSAVSGIFVPQESAQQCTATFIATLEAYTETYFTSALWGDEDVAERNPVFWLSFFSLWSMWWIHNAYPNYDFETISGDLSYAVPNFKAAGNAMDLTSFADTVLGTDFKSAGTGTTVADVVATVSKFAP